MVFENPFDVLQSKAQTPSPCFSKEELVNAPILDRVLSFVIDMTLWLPLASLLLASQKKHIMTQLLLESTLSVDLIIQLIVFCILYISLFVVVYSLFLSLLGATPGQLILGIRVINRETENPPSFLLSLARGTLLSFGIITGGWTLLSIFGHSKRLAFHDLATDTLTISNKKNLATSQHHIMVRPFLKTYYLLTVSIMITVIFIFLNTFNEKAKLNLFTFMEDSKSFCQNLPEGTHLYDSAIAGFLIGSIDEACLSSFSDEIFSSPAGEFDPSWLYFSKFLLFQGEPELQGEYEDYLCKEPDSQSCSWVKLFHLRIRGSEVASFNPNSLMERVLMIRAAQFFFNFEKSFQLSSALPDHEDLNGMKFSLFAGYQAIQAKDQETQRAIANVIESWDPSFSFTQSLEMICDSNLSKACNHESVFACRKLIENENYLESPDKKVLMSRLSRATHASICSDSQIKKIKVSIQKLKPEDQKYFDLFFDLAQANSDQITGKLKSFQTLVKGSLVAEQMKVRLFQILGSRNDPSVHKNIQRISISPEFIQNWSVALSNQAGLFNKGYRSLASETQEAY